MTEIGWNQLADLCLTAIAAGGGDEPMAAALTDAVVAAERRGVPALGVAHLFDYLDALGAGRLNGAAEPVVRHERASVITVAADDGIAQLAYRHVRADLLDAARSNGVAVLSISDSFPVGELGYYTADVATEGFLALAGANATAMMSLYGVPAALTGTNPLSFALPAQPRPRLIDQASSAAAWVRIRDAADAGQRIPEGWALDADGAPTTDAAAALLGPLLPFGQVKGSNVAMIIELLAVLAGARFAVDVPDFSSGTEPTRVGMFLIALDPTAFSDDYLQRADAHLTRLHRTYGIDFGRHVPEVTQLHLDEAVYDRLVAAGIKTGDAQAGHPGA